MIYVCSYCKRTYRRDSVECDGDPNTPSHGHCPECNAVVEADMFIAPVDVAELAKRRGPVCQRGLWK